jgi:UDP-glucose 4-epimerase
MHILVTGGAGFIGSNLCDYLFDKGFQLSIIDDLSSGSIDNLSLIINKTNFYDEKIEFFNFKKLPKIDCVIHLAGQVSVNTSITSFGASSSSNILSAIRLIDYCRLNKIPLVYASSAAIYGNLGISDDSNTKKIDLLSPYATDKYMLETYAKIAFKNYKLPSLGLRFFNVYGPRQNPSNEYSGVISIFMDRLSKNKKITINGGHQTRDFIYVEDVVNVIYKSVSLLKDSIVCEQFNVLTGKSISIDKLAKLLMKQINPSCEKEYKSLSKGDPIGSLGTTQKIENLLKINLDNFLTIEKGLARTVNFISSQ